MTRRRFLLFFFLPCRWREQEQRKRFEMVDRNVFRDYDNWRTRWNHESNHTKALRNFRSFSQISIFCIYTTKMQLLYIIFLHFVKFGCLLRDFQGTSLSKFGLYTSFGNWDAKICDTILIIKKKMWHYSCFFF